MKRRLVYIALISMFCPAACLAWERGSVTWGAKVTTPQIAAVSLAVYPDYLWLVQLEPGVGGGKLNVGLGGNLEHLFGVAIKASMLQTWGWPFGE